MRIYQGAFSIGDDDLVFVSRKKRTDRNGHDGHAGLADREGCGGARLEAGIRKNMQRLGFEVKI
jgi:hypothetical protein